MPRHSSQVRPVLQVGGPLWMRRQVFEGQEPHTDVHAQPPRKAQCRYACGQTGPLPGTCILKLQLKTTSIDSIFPSTQNNSIGKLPACPTTPQAPISG